MDYQINLSIQMMTFYRGMVGKTLAIDCDQPT